MTNAKKRTFVLPKTFSLKGNWVFFVYLLLMLVGLFLRNAMGINLPPILFLAFTAIPLILGDQSHIIATAVCCIPFSTGFQYKYAILFCIAALVLKNRKHFRMNPVLIAVLGLAFWELLHGIGGGFSLSEYPRSMAELLFLASVFSFWDRERINYRLILRGYALATVGVCFIMLYLQWVKTDFDIVAVLTQSHYFRFGQGNTDFAQYTLNFNPNGLGVICCLSAGSCLFFLRKREFRVIDAILLFFSVGFCVMTLSRTAAICLAVLALGYLLLLPMPGLRKLGYFLLMAALLAIVIGVLYAVMPRVFENILLRFSAEDITNGRDTLFAFYNDHIFSSPIYLLFGIGLQSVPEKIAQIHGVEMLVPHNGFQETVVTWGVMGLALMLLLLFSILQMTRGEARRRAIAFVPFLLWFLDTNAGQLVTSSSSLLSLVLVSVYLIAEGRKDGEHGE